MRHKRKAQSLPDWFDLGKYETLKIATALEWYTQIVIRRECWDFAHGYSPALEERDEQLPLMQQGGAAQELLALIQRDGIVAIEDLRRICKPDIWGDHILGEIDRLELSVHPLTIEELYLARLGIDEDRRERFDQLFIAERTPEGQSPYFKHIELKNSYHGDAYENSGIGDGVYNYQKSGMCETGLSTFRVNLRLPDSLLVQQFRTCLRKSRKIGDLKTRKTVRRQSTKQWAKYRILPYIDLALWTRLTGAKITKTSIADALFPNGEKRDAETVRKTVRPLAMSLLRRHSMPFQQLKHEAARLKNECS